MTSFPAATRKDHLTFCHTEGWEEVRRATGKKVNHHLTFELALEDGRILRTRISHPPGKDTYGKSLWTRILREQLDVTEPIFWACVKDGARPERSAPHPAKHAIPADLFHLLTAKAGYPQTQVCEMTKDEAIAAAGAYWQRGGD